MQKKRCTYRRKTDYSSCKASAGFTRIACAAGNQIPAITIKVIRKKVNNETTTKRSPVASACSVIMASAITRLPQIIRAGIAASTNNSNPSPNSRNVSGNDCFPSPYAKLFHYDGDGYRNQKVPINPIKTLKLKNIAISRALRIYGVIPRMHHAPFSVHHSYGPQTDRTEQPATEESYHERSGLQNHCISFGTHANGNKRNSLHAVKPIRKRSQNERFITGIIICFLMVAYGSHPVTKTTTCIVVKEFLPQYSLMSVEKAVSQV